MTPFFKREKLAVSRQHFFSFFTIKNSMSTFNRGREGFRKTCRSVQGEWGSKKLLFELAYFVNLTIIVANMLNASTLRWKAFHISSLLKILDFSLVFYEIVSSIRNKPKKNSLKQKFAISYEILVEIVFNLSICTCTIFTNRPYCDLQTIIYLGLTNEPYNTPTYNCMWSNKLAIRSSLILWLFSLISSFFLLLFQLCAASSNFTFHFRSNLYSHFHISETWLFIINEVKC